MCDRCLIFLLVNLVIVNLYNELYVYLLYFWEEINIPLVM